MFETIIVWSSDIAILMKYIFKAQYQWTSNFNKQFNKQS